MQSGGVAFEAQHADVCSLLALNRTRQRHEHNSLEVVSTRLARCPFAEQGQLLHALDAIRLEAREFLLRCFDLQAEVGSCAQSETPCWARVSTSEQGIVGRQVR
eukprot:3050077-Amphidinium_carterae.1